MTLAGPYLDELSALTGDTIHLAIREGDEVLYLHKNPGRNGPEMRSRGRPSHAAWRVPESARR